MAREPFHRRTIPMRTPLLAGITVASLTLAAFAIADAPRVPPPARRLLPEIRFKKEQVKSGERISPTVLKGVIEAMKTGRGRPAPSTPSTDVTSVSKVTVNDGTTYGCNTPVTLRVHLVAGTRTPGLQLLVLIRS